MVRLLVGYDIFCLKRMKALNLDAAHHKQRAVYSSYAGLCTQQQRDLHSGWSSSNWCLV